MNARKPYAGKSRKLIIAIDVGTTFSGVSYSILDPGQVPQVCGVNRFPAQEHAGGDSKIPSVLLYDKSGNVRAAGAETLQEDMMELAIDEGWFKSEWFKLHLRPRGSDPDPALAMLPPLPDNKSIVDVFADFLSYLFDCARTYIKEIQPTGAKFWSTIANNIDFVLTHPNGWEGQQQSLMRQAAVQGGLVADSDEGKGRVSFVTEGEASLHFCLSRGLVVDGMKDGKGVVIVDAGGGTVDLSAYAQVRKGADVSYTEIAPAQCLFKGAIMVKRNAQAYIEARLRNSKFSERTEDIVDAFDKSTKLTFKNAKTPAYVKFGGISDNDAAYDVKGGKLVIPGSEVAKFFQPTITSISQAVSKQRKQANSGISSIFLVGGFAASSFLYSQLCDSLAPLGLDVSRPDSHMNKAVADGGVLYIVDHHVTARVAKFTYGTNGSIQFSRKNKEHVKRRLNTHFGVDGIKRVNGSFFPILDVGIQVTETQEFSVAMMQLYEVWGPYTRHAISASIQVYRGNIHHPLWTDVDAANFGVLCTVKADVTAAVSRLVPHCRADGRTYVQLDYEVVLLFGLTELKAQLRWFANGFEQRTPAEVVYGDAMISLEGRSETGVHYLA